MKLIHHSLMPRSRFENECSIQFLLRHPYIMPLTDAFDFASFRAMVMPRATGGTLFDLVSSGQLRNPVVIGRIVYRLSLAIGYLHSIRILHGDIKPANVVLLNTDTNNPHPVLIDFGHAADLSVIGHCRCRLLTYSYSAPELLELRPHSFPADVWALGATLFFAVTGTEIIRANHLEIMQAAARNFQPRFHAPQWHVYPASVQTMISGMLRPDAAARITIEDCLAHQFFRDLLGSEWISTEDQILKQATVALKTEHSVAHQ